ncbi:MULTISPECIES: endo-1,4-beta-xylanase [Nostocales]|uniref:Beta-xylanase n=3 Tax=Nostocales TaxID=1161 RepID=A0A0C1N9A6_9CYAN|nr:endo-1,4-beta-xylanase [Tolypothrix bouteillei]KAF3887299.1 endo-1,4-beta-xylanase [Tolypothrix bouteillei VB521301]
MYPKFPLSRRHFIFLGFSGLASSAAVTAGKIVNTNNQVQALYNPKRDFKVVGQNSLKQRAASKGIIYGAAVEPDFFQSNASFSASFTRDCGMIVPENALKWSQLRPAPDKYDFARADWLAAFARNRGILYRGHTLVWNQDIPIWFKETVNRQNAEKILVDHITTVSKRYAGKMHSWDVVNEAIDPEDGRSDGLQSSPWLDFLGPSYIELAYRATAAADPKAMLVYNETWIEYDIPKHEARRKATLKLLENLLKKGTPIHALGIQSHLMAHEKAFNPQKLRAFLSDVASLGLKILITELDVIDQQLPADSTVRDRMVASLYEDYLSVVLDEKAVIAVLTWGLSDRYTWHAYFLPRSDGQPVRPLPLDVNFQRKLAWNAIARAFDRAPKR